MRRWERRSSEPVRWALFAAGGQLGVLLMPALVIVVGILIPFAVVGDAESTYALFSGFLTHPAGSLLAFAVLAVVLWHCCHRAYHMLHDLQIDPPEIVRALTYGLAVVIPLGAWILTLRTG